MKYGDWSKLNDGMNYQKIHAASIYNQRETNHPDFMLCGFAPASSTTK
jgi:hypothetical protein